MSTTLLAPGIRRAQCAAASVSDSGASSEAALQAGHGDLWDSRKVRSRKSVGIPYRGRALTSRQRCWWRVQFWDERDEASAPSEISWWEMGLLDPTDWTAQWLAVEDAVAKADREAGLHGIWGAPTREKTTRRFRGTFQLPAASIAGELFAVTNYWSLLTQISRIWIDGVAVGGRGRWSDNFDEVGVTESDTVRLTLPPMRAGEHLIAVEVNTAALPPPTSESALMYPRTLVHGFALFVRLNLAPGDTVRLGSGPHWKTSLAADGEWHTPRYDDAAWETAGPRSTISPGHRSQRCTCGERLRSSSQWCKRVSMP